MIDLKALGPLGFGAASLGNLYRPILDADARASVRFAWEQGLRYFDTAPHYGFGLSEKRLGAALAELDPDETAIISTKVGRRLDPAPDADLTQPRQAFVTPEPYESVFDYSYDSIMQSWEASRRRLGRDRIDILYCHDIGGFTHADDHARQMKIFLEGGFRAMQELRSSGMVGAIGLGVNETAVCEEVLGHGDLDIILLAGRYSLLEQAPLDSLFPLCESRNVDIVIGGPFNSGILATGVRGNRELHYDYGTPPEAVIARVRAIEELCDAHDVPLIAAALQFPLGHPQVVSVIPGMGSQRHVSSAVSMMAQPIPDAFWQDLRDRDLIRADAPTPHI